MLKPVVASLALITFHPSAIPNIPAPPGWQNLNMQEGCALRHTANGFQFGLLEDVTARDEIVMFDTPDNEEFGETSMGDDEINMTVLATSAKLGDKLVYNGTFKIPKTDGRQAYLEGHFELLDIIERYDTLKLYISGQNEPAFTVDLSGNADPLRRLKLCMISKAVGRE